MRKTAVERVERLFLGAAILSGSLSNRSIFFNRLNFGQVYGLYGVTPLEFII